MYQFTSEEQKPYIHILCECNRQFKREEFYCCVSCSKIQCRFCTQVQVHSYFCRNCLHTTNLSEVTIRYHCQNCFECPLCRHTLTEMKEQATEKCYLYCQFCSWNSISINFVEEKSKDLANKCIVKMKEKADPQQKHFQKVLTKYKELQMQIEKEKKIRMNPKIGKKMHFSNLLGGIQMEQLSKNWSFDKFKDQQKAKEEDINNQMYKIDMKGLMTYKLVRAEGEAQNQENPASNLEEFYCDDFDSLQDELNNFVNLKNYELCNLLQIKRFLYVNFNLFHLLKQLLAKIASSIHYYSQNIKQEWFLSQYNSRHVRLEHAVTARRSLLNLTQATPIQQNLSQDSSFRNNRSISYKINTNKDLSEQFSQFVVKSNQFYYNKSLNAQSQDDSFNQQNNLYHSQLIKSEYSPLIQIRKIHYNKISDELSVVLVMENESEQYTMNVQLDNLEEDFELAQIHNYHENDCYQLIVLRKERVEMKVVDFLDINKSKANSAPTQQTFEFILKLKEDKPKGIDLKFGFQMNLDVEYESDKSYSFGFPVVINLGKILDQIRSD